ncbi:MAG: ABC transporter ATP-binding protein [Gammaproteobacteria bacterium]|nr:ABC transporter ATP-binding protein [Gammaproteobacteria bacterium]MYD79046.1 ABC transporter ATP-binding protein [Gammaproteobacteria bacterium]
MMLLHRSHFALAVAWWLLLISRGLLPALLAVAMGMLIGAVERQSDLLAPLILLGSFFVLVQVLPPLHLVVGKNLGDHVACLLYDRLSETCVRPEGMGHLENADLTHDLALARDFDLGISGPPLSISMDFIASGLVELCAGLVACMILSAYAWWAPLVLGGAWISTHYLLRESGVWRDRNTDAVRTAQRHADYAYKIAVNPPASKEIRLFGLAGWVVERFRSHRRRLHDLRWEATRLREKPVVWSLLLVLAANAMVFTVMAIDVSSNELGLDRMVMFASLAFTTSMIAFGGLSWALDNASAPAGATMRLGSSMYDVGSLQNGTYASDSKPERNICFRNVSFKYPTGEKTILEDLNLTIPAGSSIAIVGQNGAGKTTLAKLLCRLYDPTQGSIEIDGVNLCDWDLINWRNRITAVFQDFVRYELTLRDNVDPAGQATEEVILRALESAGASDLADLDTTLSKAYAQGVDLSGGQWQRIALARALSATYCGAGIVLLDEPTAQLDVRGEREIFRRILQETRDITTILISHRFSTVRQVDHICVLEHGRVIEEGSHETLMQLNGRYRTMFDLQASRFTEEEEGGLALDVLD